MAGGAAGVAAGRKEEAEKGVGRVVRVWLRAGQQQALVCPGHGYLSYLGI